MFDRLPRRLMHHQQRKTSAFAKARWRGEIVIDEGATKHMDDRQFDAIALGYGADRSRRTAIKIVGSGAITALLGRLGLDTGRKIGAAAAEVGGNRKKKRQNSKKSQLKLNAFRCVDVGGKCRGNSANCCSGICEGKKPKKGKKDRSRCIAHNAGVCQAEQNQCVDDLTANCGGAGRCFRTTGNASFCGNEGEGVCTVCARDADCEAAFGLGAACVVCSTCEIKAGSSTACVPPAA
jgi:hypothetical protein